MRTTNLKENLCDKCMFHPVSCNSKNPKYGEGKGNDNVIECHTFRTRIEDILFRSSKIGLLAGGLIRHGLTENQREEMERLEAMKKEFVGLSEKQQEDLDAWNKKVEDGGTLTPKQMEMRDEYKARLTRFKQLTPNQEATLQKYKEHNARPPELSQGAKTYIKEVWLENEKGFREEVTDKKLRKGLQAEEDAINLISFVDNVMYVKNEERKRFNNTTGECDVITEFEELEIEHNPEKGVMFVGSPTIGKYKFSDKKVIDDTKCSWNPRTFMSASLTTLYEWQGRSYLYQNNADIFRLRHCLVDCPPDVLIDEYWKFRNENKLTKNHIIDNDLLEQIEQGQVSDKYPEEKELVEQFHRNFLYEDSGLYTQEERVKTFIIKRDFELEAILILSVKLGVEYYKTITLNMIEE